jgi:hypothetical protein
MRSAFEWEREMRRSVKVTIGRPSDMLDQTEQERLERSETRSESVRAAEETFRVRPEQNNRERYLRGDKQHPESDEEMADADRLGRQVLAAEPWG